jgi:hypothetical protein
MNTAELEYRLLYSVVVAGKSAKFADRALRTFLGESDGRSPFEYIRALLQSDAPSLCDVLTVARTGNYTKLCGAFGMAVDTGLDLATCTPMELEKIHGIGPKTSRFFILWTRPGARYAALDTHVLKWLRYLGHATPTSTPQSSKRYAELEAVILAEADRRGMTPRELDAAIWDWCSKGLHINGEWPANLQKK